MMDIVEPTEKPLMRCRSSILPRVWTYRLALARDPGDRQKRRFFVMLETWGMKR